MTRCETVSSFWQPCALARHRATQKWTFLKRPLFQKTPLSEPDPPSLVAHDCGYPLSRYTCRATRVAADFLDFIAFCRCSTGVALHPLKILVSHLPPPCAGRCRTEIWVRKGVALHGGIAATVAGDALHCATKPPSRSEKERQKTRKCAKTFFGRSFVQKRAFAHFRPLFPESGETPHFAQINVFAFWALWLTQSGQLKIAYQGCDQPNSNTSMNRSLTIDLRNVN